MVKRQRSASASEFEGSDISFDEAPKKKPKVVKKATKKAAKKGEAEADFVSATPHEKSLHVIESAEEICDALLKWYFNAHTMRAMPWRKPYNANLTKQERGQRAYEVWVSEIMLQQTQVATVIPYYNAWMTKFPTLRDLAASPIDDVNAVWKGLGYYSRASRLLAGAQKAVKEYDGLLPDNAHDMEKNIPGVGRYTAGAICSIAYGERVPVLDGNVHRLLSRFLALHASPKAKITLDILWAAADAIVKTAPVNGQEPDNDQNEMVKKRLPGDLNQSLIELGSTVCKVRAPECAACPLSYKCAAYRSTQLTEKEPPDMEDLCTICEPLTEASVTTAYPMKVEKKKSREETDLVSVVEWASSKRPDLRYFLLVRRPDEGLLAGLYEFPADANVAGTLSTRRCVDLPHQRLSKLFEERLLPLPSSNKEKAVAEDQDTEDYRIRHVKHAGDVLHIFSHIRKTYRVQWVRIDGGEAPPTLSNCNVNAKAPAMWKALQDVESANIGTGVAKIWKLVQKLW